MVLLTRRRVLAAKIESSKGTKEALTASEAAFNTFEPDFSPNIDVAKRPAQIGIGNNRAHPGSQAGNASFKNEFLSTEPNWAGVLLPAVGFKDDAAGGFTLSSASADRKAATLGLYQDGVLYYVYGAAGNLVINASVGQPIMAEFDMQGKFEYDNSETIIDPTLPADSPDPFNGATLTIGGNSYFISELTINLNNEIALIPDPTDSTGIAYAVVTARDIVVSADVEAQTGADGDWWNKMYGTIAEVALNLVVGSGDTLTIAAPALQVVSADPDDRDGVHTVNLELQANEDTAGDEDELTITWATA